MLGLPTFSFLHHFTLPSSFNHTRKTSGKSLHQLSQRLRPRLHQLSSMMATTTYPHSDAIQAHAGVSRHHVQSIDQSYEIYGVAAIWHNLCRGPDSDFEVLRGQYDCDINAMILMIAKHVEQGLYDIISMNATPHMLVVVCGVRKCEIRCQQTYLMSQLCGNLEHRLP